MTPRLLSLTARKLVRFLKKQGYIEVRQAGSHLTLHRERDRRTVTAICTPDKTSAGDYCDRFCAMLDSL